jgi:uncharacterized protein (TIGR03435 family)
MLPNIWNALVAGMAFCIALVAQPAKIEFEAVSIKPADSADPSHSSQYTRGGFRGRNLRLFELIRSAWRLNRDQIIGGPAWMETAGFDIDARFPEGASFAQAPLMMRAMLADRFRLVTHRETRTLPVYELTVAKGGIKLRAGDGTGGMSAGQRLIRYASGTMGELAGQLSGYLGRNVVDRTGLTGQYAIDLSFAPVDLSGAAGDAAAVEVQSIFQALQDQAGLKLEPARRPVEVLVIEHAEKPAAN